MHALGQVVSYPGPPPSLRSVNALLPDEVAVLEAEEVPDGFSARHDALTRSYLYRVLARRAPSPFERTRALWWPHRVDFPALQACADALAGTHDFTAFTPTDTYHQRFRRNVVGAIWERRDDLLLFRIEADTFMRHMNRVLVGTMLEVAGGPPHRARLRAAAHRPPALGGGRDGAAPRALPRVGALLRTARTAGRRCGSGRPVRSRDPRRTQWTEAMLRRAREATDAWTARRGRRRRLRRRGRHGARRRAPAHRGRAAIQANVRPT